MKNNLLFIIIILVLSYSYPVVSQTLHDDSLALVNFYHSTNGLAWTNQGNWLTGPISTWRGITLSNKRVIVISLKGNGLKGTMPSPFNISSLRDIHLDNNQIKSIDISELKALRWLHIENNGLENIITNTQENYYQSLTQFHVRGNRLKKIDVTNMPKLGSLYCSGNLLEEVKVNILPNYYPALAFVYAYNNKLRSFNVSGMKNLLRVEIHNNLLTSFDISSSSKLTALYVYGNQLKELKTNTASDYYSSLGVLMLNSNKLSSLDISNMPSVSEIRLQHNFFHFDVLESIQRWPAKSPRSPQANVNIYYEPTTSTFKVRVGGENNIYQWRKNGVNISNANLSSLTLTQQEVTANALYQCLITNSKVGGLTLISVAARPGDQIRDLSSLDFVSRTSGNWNNNDVWQLYDGIRYFETLQNEIPGERNNVFVQEGHSVILTGNSSCKDLNLNARADVVRLNTGENILDVYGKIRSYTEAVPGVNSSSAGSANWITTGTNGRIRLKGNANRIIVEKDQFSDHENLGGWTLECDLAEGVVGTINSNFRAGNVIVTSGSLEVKSENFKVSR